MSSQNQVTRDNMSSESAIQPIIIPWTERVGVAFDPIRSTSKTIGNSWIVGSSTNGIVGTNTGTQGGGQQVVGGDGQVETVERVINISNVARQYFNNTNFKDTVNTTATWDGSGSVTFTAGQVAQSLTIYKDAANVDSVTISVSEESGTFKYEISADGGTNWEEVTPSVTETLAVGTSGNDLRFRITEDNSSTGEINEIFISYNI